MDEVRRAVRTGTIRAAVLVIAAVVVGACGPPPAPTATGGPPLTPNLSGVTVPSGALVFQDDFGRPGGGWEEFAEPEASAAYTEGEYRLKLNHAPLRAWGILRDVAVPNDVTVSVTGRLASGPGSSGYGVICRFRDEDHFYFFVLTAEGNFLIGKHVGQALIGLSAPQARPSAAILPGSAPNLITAQCAGDRLSLSINATPVAEARDAELSGGWVGLMAVAADGAGIEARFDNFAVYTP